jgi:hypothetical protein
LNLVPNKTAVMALGRRGWGVIIPPPRELPKGLAFELADLVLAGSWAERYDLRAVVNFDHGAAVGEDYEEVIVFQIQSGPFCRLILWRDAEAVYVQPLVGKVRRYDSVAAALESLTPDRHRPGLSLPKTAAASAIRYPVIEQRSPGVGSGGSPMGRDRGAALVAGRSGS